MVQVVICMNINLLIKIITSLVPGGFYVITFAFHILKDPISLEKKHFAEIIFLRFKCFSVFR